jgi:hypothetical protein
MALLGGPSDGVSALHAPGLEENKMPSTSLPDVGTAKAVTAMIRPKNIDPEKLYPPKIAAEILNMSTSWLAKARLRGDGPRYVKMGRSVKYQGLDLLEYLKSKKRNSTSEC